MEMLGFQWRHAVVTPVLGKPEDTKFKVILNYILKPYIQLYTLSQKLKKKKDEGGEKVKR